MIALKQFCRTCTGLRKHETLHTVKKTGGDDEGNYYWWEEYSIIKCGGCETISFLETSGDSESYQYDDEGHPEYLENSVVFPPYLEKGSQLLNLHLIPKDIRGIYNETIASIKSGSLILAAGGLRAVIESTCNHLEIKKGDLDVKINLLHENGHISLGESKRLHSIRFLGNDALHEMELPKRNQIFILLDIVNHLLSNLFINDQVLKGNLETIIDNYDDFLILVSGKINKQNIGKSISIKELLGKSIRRVPKTKFEEFERLLSTEVTSAKFDLLAMAPDAKGEFILVKEPEPGFEW